MVLNPEQKKEVKGDLPFAYNLKSPCKHIKGGITLGGGGGIRIPITVAAPSKA
jgi:hypothetical protein